MKSTYIGKDLDVLYYFGDSNQPGFVINAYFIYDSFPKYRYYPVHEGSYLNLIDIIDNFNPSPYRGFTYPKCIEGFSLIFRNRVSSVTGHFRVVAGQYGSYDFTRTWTNTKTIGFLLEEVANGLSQIDKSSITELSCELEYLSESVDVVSVYPGLVLDFNLNRHLLNLNVHIDMPEDNGVLKGGLCLADGSLKIDDSDKYLYELMIKYEYRGIYSFVGRKFNDMFTDPEGHLIFEDGYWYHDDENDPYFSVDDNGHLILENSMLQDYIDFDDDGRLYADFDLATSNLISNRKQLVEVYLGGNNLIFKLQVSDFKYDGDNFQASIRLEDILNRLSEVLIPSIEGYVEWGQMKWLEFLQDELEAFLSANHITFPTYVSDVPPNELDIRMMKRFYPNDEALPIAENTNMFDFLSDLMAQLGQVMYVKTIDSTKSNSWVNYECFDFGLIVKPAINTAGQLKSLLRYDGNRELRPFQLVDQRPYVIDNSFILGKITRSVIKPNHISKVIGTYYGYNFDEDIFDDSLEYSYSIGDGNFTYQNDCNAMLFYDIDSGTEAGDMYLIDPSHATHTPFYRYMAETLINKYVFGLDELSFSALLSKDYGDPDAAAQICFGLGECFQIDFSNTIIPTNYAYQIISSSLVYDGALRWDLVGLQV